MLGNYKEGLKINVNKKVTLDLSAPHSGHTLVLVHFLFFMLNVVFAVIIIQEDDGSSLCECHHQAN